MIMIHATCELNFDLFQINELLLRLFNNLKLTKLPHLSTLEGHILLVSHPNLKTHVPHLQ